MAKQARLQKITATKTRNNFFKILDSSFKKKKIFIVEKSGIPMAYIVPAEEFTYNGDKNLKLLDKVERFRKSMRKTTDSVKLLREIRKYGK